MFKILVEPNAIRDIQNAIDYYDDQLLGLGKRFEKEFEKHVLILTESPFFQIRYDNVRCIPLKKFPFMIHNIVEESQKEIKIFAVFHTALNPETNWKKI